MSDVKPMKSIQELIDGTELKHKAQRYINHLHALVRDALNDGIFLQIEPPFIPEEAIAENAELPKHIVRIDGYGLQANLPTKTIAKGVKTEITLSAEFLVAKTEPDADGLVYAVQFLGDDKPLTRFNGEVYHHKGKEDGPLEGEGTGEENVSASASEPVGVEGQSSPAASEEN